MNKNYRRGVRLERRVQDDLEAQGYFVIRAAGSKGVADLCALRVGATPQLIQCKLDCYLRPAEREEFLEVAHQAGADAIVVGRENKQRLMWKRLSYEEGFAQ